MGFKVYLAGGMKNVDKLTYNTGRRELENAVRSAKQVFFSKPVSIIDPAYHFDYDNYYSQKQVYDYETTRIRKCDCVLVDFRFSTESIGTAIELTIAKENHIPIIGVGDVNNIHPWNVIQCEMIFETPEEAGTYIVKHYVED